jgi:ketosteroid isomerase-like protein
MFKSQLAGEPDARSAALEHMMERYRRAWETRDADLAASLFTEDATYQEGPFSEPMAGRAAIRRYWEQATGSHREVRFRWKCVCSVGQLHVVEWQASFVRGEPGLPVELRGVMLIELRGEHIWCFREYWLRRETSGAR